MGGSGRAWRLAAAACMASQLLTGTSAAQTGGDPNPGAITLTGSMDASNAYLFRGIPQDDTGLILWPAAGPGRGAQVGRRLRAQHHRERGDVEQPPHGHHGRGWAQRQAVVRVGLLDERRRRVRGRRERGRNLHGVHESERRVPEREGAVAQSVGRRARHQPLRARGVRAPPGAGGRRRGGRAVPRASGPRQVWAWPASPCLRR